MASLSSCKEICSCEQESISRVERVIYRGYTTERIKVMNKTNVTVCFCMQNLYVKEYLMRAWIFNNGWLGGSRRGGG